MKRFFFALVPWMAMATGALAQVQPATVSLTYHGVLPGAAYRLGDECFATAEFMRQAGWHCTKLAERMVIEAEGKDVDVPIRKISGVVTFPLRIAIDKMGGTTVWEANDQLDALAVISKATVRGTHVQVDSTLPVNAKVSFFDSPNRIIVDFAGAQLAKPGGFEVDEHSRIGQFQDDVARIVIQSDTPPPALPDSLSQPTTHFDLDLQASGQTSTVAPAAQSEPGTSQPQAPTPNTLAGREDDASDGGVLSPPPPDDAPLTAPPADGPLAVQMETTNSLLLSLKLAAPLTMPPKIARQDPTLIEITFPNANVVVGAGFKLDTQTISSVSTRKEGNDSIVSIRTARPVGVEVSNTANEFRLRFMKPDVGDGKLAGKLIVVDPGHGGHDTGAKSPDKTLLEKNLVLDIANNVAEKLAEDGATVIMTRKSDVFIPLTERADIANRNHADFFISIHINSNSLSEQSTQGRIVFYHGTNQTSQLLAESLQHEITPLTTIPNMGVWSDTKIYRTGFSVLRNTTMPGVLIECGFINNHNDRVKLQTEEYREGLALGVVRGLKVFLGDVKTN